MSPRASALPVWGFEPPDGRAPRRRSPRRGMGFGFFSGFVEGGLQKAWTLRFGSFGSTILSVFPGRGIMEFGGLRGQLSDVKARSGQKAEAQVSRGPMLQSRSPKASIRSTWPDPEFYTPGNLLKSHCCGIPARNRPYPKPEILP